MHEPWSRVNDVARILEYARPSNDIIDHVPERFKQNVQCLMETQNGPKMRSTELVDLNARTHAKKSMFSNLNMRDLNLIHEVLYHANFCMETAEKFHGREDFLNVIKQYILNFEIDTPFVLHGNSGCGKTAILAKITSQVS